MPFLAAGQWWVSCSASLACQKRAALLGVCGVAVWLTACLRVAWSCAVRACMVARWGSGGACRRQGDHALAHAGAGWSSSACARWWRRRGALVLLLLPRWVCGFAACTVGCGKGQAQESAAGCMLSKPLFSYSKMQTLTLCKKKIPHHIKLAVHVWSTKC